MSGQLPESTPLSRVLPAKAVRAFGDLKAMTTLGDVILFAPKRYLDQDELTRFDTLRVGERVSIVGKVRQATRVPMRRRQGHLLKVVLADEADDTLDLTFFRPFGHETALRPGRRGIFNGTVEEFNHRLQLTHPDYAMLDDEGDSDGESGGTGTGLARYRGYLLPVYVESKSLTSAVLRRAVMGCLDAVAIDEPVPPQVYARHDLMSRHDAIWAVQRPVDRATAAAGLRRLRYDEALVLQVLLAQRRLAAASVPTTPRTPRADGILAAFDATLPFALTAGQIEVGERIAADLARPTPMHRLLQGEVGSGKTIVALRAMLSIIDAGGQAALLAPTEVLASQHHMSISAMLGPLGQGGTLTAAMAGTEQRATRLALLTGGQTAAQRRQGLLDAACGAAGIVIGTHALLQEQVSFADLALVVVDEQHRFGVEQRDALRDKADTAPHTLVMTATPIPRTVAMTVFGDLEVSTLRELPSGRAPIATVVVDETKPGWWDRVWARAGEEIAAGRQVFVVCPKIGDEPGEEDQDEAGADPLDEEAAPAPREPSRGVHEIAAEAARQLAGHGDVRIETLHGRMSADDKETVMRAVVAGEIDVLVATTVIEVGIDVPNATLMVVVDADRFGVSQLHQLRGRVGRGGHASLCLLTTRTGDAVARERLAAVAGTTDGFELARIDLAQRREGDILGARQSGTESSLRFLKVTQDEDLIARARQDAIDIVDADPELTRPEHRALADAVRARLERAETAFLERG